MNEKRKNEILAKEMIATFQRWIDKGDGDDALGAISKEALELIRPALRRATR